MIDPDDNNVPEIVGSKVRFSGSASRSAPAFRRSKRLGAPIPFPLRELQRRSRKTSQLTQDPREPIGKLGSRSPSLSGSHLPDPVILRVANVDRAIGAGGRAVWAGELG
jgi:hypothetical protein